MSGAVDVGEQECVWHKVGNKHNYLLYTKGDSLTATLGCRCRA